jgi:hypothetical protein
MTISTIEFGNQMHVFVVNPNGTVFHWWQNAGATTWTSPGGGSETLPAPA